jgi:hypothetical protein
MNPTASLWRRDDLVAEVPSFLEVYRHRPLADNSGGMTTPHLFAAWCILRWLRPKVIVESGVWKGQGTWLIERSCPDARLFCCEPAPHRIEYRSSRAVYFDRDLKYVNWDDLIDRADADRVLFFLDDHQNALERLKTIGWLGFRHAIFEDNYPPGQGDCYSLKMALAGAGFRSNGPQERGIRRVLRKTFGIPAPDLTVAANDADRHYLGTNLEAYEEFPPVVAPERNRWGEPWGTHSTPPALLSVPEVDPEFVKDAGDYTWICYARLAGARPADAASA